MPMVLNAHDQQGQGPAVFRKARANRLGGNGCIIAVPCSFPHTKENRPNSKKHILLSNLSCFTPLTDGSFAKVACSGHGVLLSDHMITVSPANATASTETPVI